MISEERKAVLERVCKEWRLPGSGLLGSGYKDMYRPLCHGQTAGKFAEMSGVDIPEYTLVSPDNKDIVIDWDGTKLEALLVFNDQLLQWVGNMQKFLDDSVELLLCRGRTWLLIKEYFYGEV